MYRPSPKPILKLGLHRNSLQSVIRSDAVYNNQKLDSYFSIIHITLLRRPLVALRKQRKEIQTKLGPGLSSRACSLYLAKSSDGQAQAWELVEAPYGNQCLFLPDLDFFFKVPRLQNVNANCIVD